MQTKNNGRAFAGFRLLAAPLLVAIAGAMPAEAQAQEKRYGCACVHNKVGTTIKYRYAWGNASWKTVSLRPKYRQWLCWRYKPGSKSSPPLKFQLDVDMSKGSAWTTYKIPRMQSVGRDCDAIPNHAHYDIRYRPNTNRGFIRITRRP